MRAVILAGGRGTRLHPLTNTIPKPLAPMFDRPVMAHAIELLAAHGIRDITVTLGYRAGQIMEWFGSGRRMGVNIDYYVEETPRGTAGGLKDMASRFQGTFVVLSGDALTDFDLSAAIRFHQRNHAWATLLSYEVNDPSQFGLVQTDADGRIKRFIEKPSPGQVFGHTVNTGIYVLEPSVIDFVPDGVAFDFSRDLFPRLLETSGRLWAVSMGGYWCDVGNLGQYRDAHFDALAGSAKVNIPGYNPTPGVWVGEGCEIHPTARICPPVYLGHGTKVCAEAFLGGYAVIGEGSKIDVGARVAQSIVGKGAFVAAESTVFGSVIGDEHILEDGVDIANRVVITADLERDIQPVTDIRLIEGVAVDMRHYLWENIQKPEKLSVTQPKAAAA